MDQEDREGFQVIMLGSFATQPECPGTVKSDFVNKLLKLANYCKENKRISDYINLCVTRDYFICHIIKSKPTVR